ncbi:NADP-specific glutamate dehydrogenase [Vagococcus carniphilus]|uniref:NADP-specific glutamate dehydrogenase n=1 Tax=Vagococcus carniphilus TaxID=218144 RepID=UPI00288F0F5B|nr:NADP-specific glutamate dehydrogenase [Vagococcus carniphilus]MDT2848468.1 NADP-specific glutamate dehydrogenase [Vagococcus carniphilus]
MTEIKQYLDNLENALKEKYPDQKEYLQAVAEFMGTIEPFLMKNPIYVEKNILELLLIPERLIEFRIPWMNDRGEWKVNTGYRVQYNSALGPYKGGMRFHPTVNQSIMKFLAFEQIFKNSLTSLPIGGGKGGSDFDPKGKSDGEIMRFCQSLMQELQKYIGPNTDVPAGDIGVGGREIGYLFGEYKRLKGYQSGVLTGKPLAYWGSLARTEATGYGLVYFVQHLLNDQKETLKDKKVLVSGSGNVAIYAIQKAQELGAKVYGCSDSSGYVIDPDGIDLELVRDIKEVNRERINVYLNKRPKAKFYEGKNIWEATIAYDIALPCATQNEITPELAKIMVNNGVKVVAEGANMPTTLEALEVLNDNQIIYCPGKASNAGGVAVSALEMAQNAQRLPWTFEKVDQELNQIMKNIYETCRDTSLAYLSKEDLVAGANMAGFEKVAKAMLSQGLV